MATLQSHGRKLDTFEYFACRIVIMSDGQLLRDSGAGYKLYRKVKPGLDVAQVARDIRKRYDANPESFHAYIRSLRDLADIRHRGLLHESVTLSIGDPDGGVTEFNDFFNASICFEDYADLCRLYSEVQAYERERAMVPDTEPAL